MTILGEENCSIQIKWSMAACGYAIKSADYMQASSHKMLL